MGYYSKFGFNSNSDKSEILKEKINKRAFPALSVFEWWNWNCGDGVKWNNCIQHCTDISMDYPEENFEIISLGEDGFNVKYVFLDGKHICLEPTDHEIRFVMNAEKNYNFENDFHRTQR